MNTKLVYFGIIMIILVLAWFSVPQAFAQQSTRQLLKQLQAEGRENCEIWQINDYLYKPVRINIVHQPIDKHIVSITSEGGGEIFWDGSKETFQLVAVDTDRYYVELILDYEFKHEEPRQVFYQVFAEGRNLVMEGNWVHEGFTFCKIIDFWTDKAPTELTKEEILQINNEFNSDFRKEVAKQNTTVQTGILILAIVVITVAIMITVYFIIIIISQRAMALVSKKPAKKLNEMIEAVRKLVDVMRLQSEYSVARDKEMKDNIYKKIENSLRDLAIMTVGTKQKIELEASFPSAQSLVGKGEKPLSTVPPVVDEKQQKEQKENLEVYEQGYGTESLLQKGAEIKEEITFATLSDEPKQTPQEKPEPEEETIEVNVKDIKPCVYCGKTPEYLCEICNKMFCAEHESHKCKNEQKKSLGTKDLISSVTEKIIKSVMEKKDSITTSDEKMQKLFDQGTGRIEVKDMLIKQYMKIPYKEAREIYDKMQKDYEKKKTFPNSVRIEAMMERLVRSDT